MVCMEGTNCEVKVAFNIIFTRKDLEWHLEHRKLRLSGVARWKPFQNLSIIFDILKLSWNWFPCLQHCRTCSMPEALYLSTLELRINCVNYKIGVFNIVPELIGQVHHVE